MILIGVDTSGKQGSLALARPLERAEAGSAVEILEVVPLAGGTFSAQLIPQLSDALVRNGFAKQDIGGFAVASGPGSFTGLRVGLAAVKGLAEVLGKPIAAVSLLEAVVWASDPASRKARDAGQIGDSRRTLVWAALDAGRGEVYLGEYEEKVGTRNRLAEFLVSRAELAAAVGDTWVVTPDENVADVLRSAGRNVEVAPHPGSAGVVRLGWEKLRAGNVVTPEDLEAAYIRKSDAEIFFKPASRS